jgi:hypothetical protein
MNHLISQQFAGIGNQPTASPKPLNKGVSKFYPELTEMIDLQIKQEQLQQLRANHSHHKY